MDEEQNQEIRQETGRAVTPGAAKRAEMAEVRGLTRQEREAKRTEKKDSREPEKVERASAREEKMSVREERQAIRERMRVSDRDARKALRKQRHTGGAPAEEVAADGEGGEGGIKGIFKRITGQ